MKHLSTATIALALIMAACSSDNDGQAPAEGQGRLEVTVGTGAGFLATRALDEDAYRLATNYNVEVTDADGRLIHSYSLAENAHPAAVDLPIGTYTVRAYYGAEHAASRDEFLCQDSRLVNIVSGEHTACALNCQPTCGKVAVSFDPAMDTYFDDYSVTYETKALGASTALWAKADSEPWYLLVDAAGETVRATISLTPKAAYDLNTTHTEGATGATTVVRTHLLRPNKAWTLTVAPNYTQTNGRFSLTIDIDESTNDKQVDIEIPSEWI